MARSKRDRQSEARRRFGFELLEERRLLSVSVELASKAAWSPESSNGTPSLSSVYSDDGRYMFFESTATNLVSGLTYTAHDMQNIYRLDRQTNEIELVSYAGSWNVAANGYCQVVDLSSDGNLIVFRSFASLLNPIDEGDDWNYYVRNLETGATRMVNLNFAGTERIDANVAPNSLSADGTKLVFSASARQLDPLESSYRSNVYVLDTATGATQLVSVQWDGTGIGNRDSGGAQISDDGSTVVFISTSSDLHPLDTNPNDGKGDVYARNLFTNVTHLVTTNAAGTAGIDRYVYEVDVSSDGRRIVFSTNANGVRAGDQSGDEDAFVRDLDTNTTRWVNSGSNYHRGVRFISNASKVFFVGLNGCYVHDLSTQTTSLVFGTASAGMEFASISADGQIVAFTTRKSLVPADNDGERPDAYVVDRTAGTLRLASTNATESLNDIYDSGVTGLSPDGQTVVISSDSDALVEGDANFRRDLFTYHLPSGDLELLTRHADGLEWTSGNSDSNLGPESVSADGRYTAFSSYATNLVEGLPHSLISRVYRYDRVTDTVELASVDLLFGEADSPSYKATISADGNVVAFLNAPHFLPGIPSGPPNLYVRDFVTGTTRRVATAVYDEPPSISADGRRVVYRRGSSVFVYDWNVDDTEMVTETIAGSGGTFLSVTRPVISANGRVVAFASYAHNLHPLDAEPPVYSPFSSDYDVFARDLETGVMHLVSVNRDGTAGGNADSTSPSISADGNRIAFESGASDLRSEDVSWFDSVHRSNIFVRDLAAGSTVLASPDFLGIEGSNGYTESPIISADGSAVVFGSDATNLHPLNGSKSTDVYVFDIETGELHWASKNTSPAGGTGDDESNYDYQISGNGNVVVFNAEVHRYNALAYNLQQRATRLVSVNALRPEDEDGSSQHPTPNYEGDVVAYGSNGDIYVAAIVWDAPTLLGDFNRDGSVDAADYTVWRSASGQQGLAAYASADGNGDGRVDALDYSVWKAHFGESLPVERTPLVVDTLEDEIDGDLSPGDLSLRETLAVANARLGRDEIHFAEALTAGGAATIRLTLGELTISDELDVVGPGDELLAIDAQQQSRVLSVSAMTGDVALRGLTLKNGRTTGSGANYQDRTYGGGAIRSFTLGRLFIEDSTIRDNRTTGDYGGGGAVIALGELAIANSRISESGTDGRASYGGGLQVFGLLTLLDSVVSGNDTQGIYAGGGGINARNDARIYRSLITGNSAKNWDGGGIFSTEDVTILYSTISGNWVEQGKGGGVSVLDNLKMYDSTVSGNFTLSDGGRGGGIYLDGPANIVRSTIANNHTFGRLAAGGGIYGQTLTIEDSEIVGNGTLGEESHGGGIATGRATIRRSTVDANSTVGQDASGGGIYSREWVTLVNGTVSGNRTIGDEAPGGGIWVYRELGITQSTISGNSTAGIGSHGGGIAVPQTGDKFFAHSSIAENRAINADGGGIWIGFGPLTLVNSVVAGNFAAGENADLRIDNAGSGAGEMLALDESSTKVGEVTPSDTGQNSRGTRPFRTGGRTTGVGAGERRLRTDSRAVDAVLSTWIASRRVGDRTSIDVIENWAPAAGVRAKVETSIDQAFQSVGDSHCRRSPNGFRPRLGPSSKG